MAYVVQQSPGRWTAYYRDSQNKRRSAGTYSSEDEARRVAEAQERFSGSGVTPQQRATVTLREYAETWLPTHPVSPSTRKSYRSVLDRHVLPALGHRRVAEIDREACRLLIAHLVDKDVSPAMVGHAKATMSALFRTAWDDGYRQDNPVEKLKIPRKSRKPITVMTPEQFKALHAALPTAAAKLFARTVVATGARFGEMTALTVADIDFSIGRISLCKAVVDAGVKWSGTGERFLVNPYTKTGDSRSVSVDATTLAALKVFVTNLSPDAVVFSKERVLPQQTHTRRTKNRPPITPEILAGLGRVEHNQQLYSHGTVSAYTTAQCRCDWCRQAMSDYARERKRARSTAQRQTQTGQPYLSKEQWRLVWKAAVEAAGIPFEPTAYQMRHTSASWLIDGGEDVKTVMGRLGHKDLSTTSRYVHQVNDDQSSADILGGLLG